jgi:hypothetical protein
MRRWIRDRRLASFEREGMVLPVLEPKAIDPVRNNQATKEIPAQRGKLHLDPRRAHVSADRLTALIEAE